MSLFQAIIKDINEINRLLEEVDIFQVNENY